MALSLSQTFNSIWVNAGVVNTGAPTAFSSTNGNFPTSNGQNITVAGAGAAGADLVTTVSANVSTTAETLAAGASTTVANAVWTFGAGCTASGTIGKFTPAGAVAAGDCICIGINTDPSITVSSVADTSGNTWVACGAGISNGDYFQMAYVCLNAKAASAGTLTITITFSSTPPFTSVQTTVEGVQFTGSPWGWIQEAFATGNGTGTNVVTGSFSTKSQNAALFAFTGVDSSTTGVLAGTTAVPTASQTHSNATFGDASGDTGLYKIVSTVQSGITLSSTQANNAIFLITGMAFAPVTVIENTWPDRHSVPSSHAALAQAFASKVTPPAGASVPTQFAGSWPDIVHRPAMHPSLMQTFAEPPRPERTSVLAAASWPDQVLPPPRSLALMTAYSGFGADVIGPIGDSSFPDGFPPPRLPVAAQQAFAVPVMPERTAPLADAGYPHGFPAPSRHAALAMASAAPTLPPAGPAAPTQFAGYQPDRVPRAPRAADYPAFAAPPALERTAPIAATSWPDRVPPAPGRPDLVPFAATPIAPERTSPIASVTFPDRLPLAPGRPDLQAFAAAPSTLERPAPIAATSWPDRFPAPGPDPSRQDFSSTRTVAPERTSPIAATSFPDRVPPAPGRPDLQAFTAMAPKPEAPLPEPHTVWPDRMEPQTLHASRQAFAPTLAPSPITNPPAPTEGYATFSDRVDRPTFHPSLQQTTTSVPPLPNTTTAQTYYWPRWPDALPMVRIDPAAMQAFASPLAPERTTPLASSSFPDWLPRPALSVADQQAVTGEPPAPERTSSIASTSFPDWIARANFPTAAQQAATTEPPVPERSAPIAATSWPDRLDPLAFHPSRQAFEAHAPSPLPNQSAPIEGYASFPDRNDRPTLHASLQQATPSTPPLPNTAAALTYSWPRWPDTLPLPRLSVAAQQAFAEAPAPERSAPIAASSYPDWIARASFPVANQQAATSEPPRPERSFPIAATSWPDRLEPQTLHASLQAFSPTLWPIPIPVPTVPLVSYPDYIVRIVMLPHHQMFSTEIPPFPQPNAPVVVIWLSATTPVIATLDPTTPI